VSSDQTAPASAEDPADVEAEPSRRPLTGGAVMSAASRISVAITGAASTIVVARLLGPSGAGAYAVALTLIAMLTVATTLGIEHGIAYYASSGQWSARDAHGSSQLVALGSGCVGIGIGMLARTALPSAFHGLTPLVTLIAVLGLPFALSWFYGTYVALASDDYEGYVLPPALQSGAAVCLVAALAVLDGVRGAVIGFTAAHVLAAAATLLMRKRWLARHPSALEPTGGERQLRRAMGFGIKGYASNALQFVNYRLDLLILNATATGAAVGHYSVAVSVTSVMWLLPQALSDVLFPRVASLSAAANEQGHQMRAFVEAKSMRHTVIVTLAVSAVVAAALLLLVVPVYGPAFEPAITLGLILLPGVALLGLTGPLSAAILGRGHPELSLISTAIVTPVTVVLYVLLIPALDATGAALASTISYSATFALAAFFYRRVTGARLLVHMLPGRSELADFRSVPTLVAQRLRTPRRKAMRG
jgi:O-antigen/teichoic acid export membrane protein